MTTRRMVPLLHDAIRIGDVKHVTQLLDAGVFVDVPDARNDMRTALHESAAYGYAAMVSLLISRHAVVDVRNAFGWTPLMCAARDGNDEVVEILLDHQANVNARDTSGISILFHTVANWQTTTVNILLRRGADVWSHEDVEPPLHRAVNQPNIDCVRSLLAAGADADRIYGGVTALVVAQRRNFIDVVNVIEQHIRGTWSKESHEALVELVLAVAALNVPPYVLMWTIDFLPEFTRKPEVRKITLIERVYGARTKVLAQRADQSRVKR